MKYLNYPVLLQLSELLSSNPSPEARVNVRFEAYSNKQIAKERKMFKEMEEAYVSGQEEMDEMSFSPEMKEAGLSSVFGRLDVKESRKVHFLLVSTLNSAFPDHDFSALRPDHFTREISASQVLLYLTNNLIGTAGIDLTPLSNIGASTSPSSFTGPSSLPSGFSSVSSGGGDQILWRILNQVFPMEECEVFSWFPEPEYDPHIDPEEDEEATEIEDDEDENSLEAVDEMDVDNDMPIASWGQAGMELDDADVVEVEENAAGKGTAADPIDLRMSSSPHFGPIDPDQRVRKVGGLLWSANYFFYSKRQKRVLFLTIWCRKRPSHRSPGNPSEHSLPLPLSASISPPSTGFQGLSALAARPKAVNRHHNFTNHRPGHRKKLAKQGGAASGSSILGSSLGNKQITASTIPIRGLSSPNPQISSGSSRLAASAPSTYATMNISSSSTASAAMAKMSAGGFKPKQTPARVLINAAAGRSLNRSPIVSPPIVPNTAEGSRNLPSGVNINVRSSVVGVESGLSEKEVNDETASSRVRKERSESLASTSAVHNLVNSTSPVHMEASTSKGKRVKV